MTTTATTTASVTLVRTRFCLRFNLRVNGKAVTLGGDRFAHRFDDSQAKALRLLEAEAARRGLAVLSSEFVVSESRNARWTLRATLGSAAC